MPETNDKKQSAIERAREYGIDITLIESNLRLTPTERLQELQEWMENLEEFDRARSKFTKRVSPSDST